MLVTNRRHDVVAFDISDPLGARIADVGIIALEDARSGRQPGSTPGDLRWRDDFTDRSRS